MFKGLRTKIESERTGQGNIRNLRETQAVNSSSLSQRGQDEFKSQTFNRIIQKNGEAARNDNIPITQADSHGPLGFSFQTLKLSSPDTNSSRNDDLLETLGELRSEISGLSDQLRSVIKERDESNDQNAQLYQLIEKLRRNLDTEKEINSSLRTKLNETELALKERNDSMEGFKNRPLTRISVKSSESNEIPADNIDGLRLKVGELQNQLSGKNRQLRIRQQNLNDIKKALQKEMAVHSKTQDELTKAQNQLRQHVQNNNCQNDCATLQNGSAHSDTDGILKTPSDKNQEAGMTTAFQDSGEEATEAGTSTLQLDRISCLSRSSASVDDFDSNDLQHGNCNKEVNHEYLRNVLFRYMTSNDTETTQHLVKALSVLMNFTPEQSAAVKSAMNAKSTWLRLK